MDAIDKTKAINVFRVKSSPINKPITMEESKETESQIIFVIIREGSDLRKGRYKKLVLVHKTNAMT